MVSDSADVPWSDAPGPSCALYVFFSWHRQLSLVTAVAAGASGALFSVLFSIWTTVSCLCFKTRVKKMGQRVFPATWVLLPPWLVPHNIIVSILAFNTPACSFVLEFKSRCSSFHESWDMNKWHIGLGSVSACPLPKAPPGRGISHLFLTGIGETRWGKDWAANQLGEVMGGKGLFLELFSRNII